jgi:broad specificity phosphatase PhoE
MILLRHGQSEFNLRYTATRVDPGIRDARLTEYGHHQAARAADILAGQRITRVVASPYTRALQTAEPIARRLGIPIEIEPIVRERFGLACDIGTGRTELEHAWPMHDFSGIEEKWWPDRLETPAEVAARAKRFCRIMASTPDWKETLVISHWGFILCMTGQSIENGATITCDPTAPPTEQSIWKA